MAESGTAAKLPSVRASLDDPNVPTIYANIVDMMATPEDARLSFGLSTFTTAADGSRELHVRYNVHVYMATSVLRQLHQTIGTLLQAIPATPSSAAAPIGGGDAQP